MSEAKDYSDLRRLEWKARTGLSLARVGRAIKMMKPLCEPCQRLGGQWWENCEHDPYYSHVEREINEPVIEEHEDGTREIVGRRVTVVEDVVPNIRQIGTMRNQSSGVGVEKALAKGFKHLPDMGIQPMCEYLNCFSHDIAVRSRYGNFCSEGQARQVALRVLEKPVEIHNPRRAKQQVDEIAL